MLKNTYTIVSSIQTSGILTSRLKDITNTLPFTVKKKKTTTTKLCYTLFLFKKRHIYYDGISTSLSLVHIFDKNFGRHCSDPTDIAHPLLASAPAPFSLHFSYFCDDSPASQYINGNDYNHSPPTHPFLLWKNTHTGVHVPTE